MIGRRGERGSGISVLAARHDDDETVYSCRTELFELEPFICIRMNLALNNLQGLICHKTKRNIQFTITKLNCLKFNSAANDPKTIDTP